MPGVRTPEAHLVPTYTFRVWSGRSVQRAGGARKKRAAHEGRGAALLAWMEPPIGLEPMT